jgi:DNA invertase Pin-like site-specific DNA recombinase
MPDFVAYYRVSTDQQGSSGLGMDAQRFAVSRHVGDSKLLAEYVEVESGKRHDNRPQLLSALADCRKRRATLVIAKLDRLARNVHFITGLMESKVDFICCDNPHANKTMLQMLAVFAEHERDQISQRTKAALAEAKRRGTKLGNPRIADAQKKAQQTHHARRPASEVLALIVNWRQQGWVLRRIADELNRLGIRPSRGKQWYGSSVRNCLL